MLSFSVCSTQVLVSVVLVAALVCRFFVLVWVQAKQEVIHIPDPFFETCAR